MNPGGGRLGDEPLYIEAIPCAVAMVLEHIAREQRQRGGEDQQHPVHVASNSTITAIAEAVLISSPAPCGHLPSSPRGPRGQPPSLPCRPPSPLSQSCLRVRGRSYQLSAPPHWYLRASKRQVRVQQL